MEKYLFEQSLILIPVLNVLGLIIKQIEKINDKYIPLILLFFAFTGAFLLGGVSVQSAIQAVLVTGTAVYGDQLVKQMKK